jgi:hypothetical protein
MYGLRMGLCPLIGVALLAACSDRNPLTASSTRPLAGTAALVDRPYTWSFQCNGDGGISATWSWTENGTVLASSSADCFGSGQLSGTGARPAIANGFTATVGRDSQSWTFDSTGPFKASLNGSVGWGEGNGGKKCGMFGCWKESGKLTVNS